MCKGGGQKQKHVLAHCNVLHTTMTVCGVASAPAGHTIGTWPGRPPSTGSAKAPVFDNGSSSSGDEYGGDTYDEHSAVHRAEPKPEAPPPG
jgi:hypothetical protein